MSRRRKFPDLQNLPHTAPPTGPPEGPLVVIPQAPPMVGPDYVLLPDVPDSIPDETDFWGPPQKPFRVGFMDTVAPPCLQAVLCLMWLLDSHLPESKFTPAIRSLSGPPVREIAASSEREVSKPHSRKISRTDPS